MFKSNQEENKSGEVGFKDMTPETLDAILLFLHRNDVKKMKTVDQLTMLLETCHMMALQDLFQYCCTSLVRSLSPETFLSVWRLAEKYKVDRMLAEVKSYFLGNVTDILTSKGFLESNINQLKSFMIYFKSNVSNVDEILKGIVLWVLHEQPAREQFIDELLTYIDENRVGKNFIQSLLLHSEHMTVSAKLALRKKHFVTVCSRFLQGREFSGEHFETVHLKICGHKLLFLAQESTTKVVDGPGKVEANSERFGTCIQLLDLDTMMWQPMKRLSCINFKVDAMCPYNACICFVGSTAGNAYVLYDVSKNSLEYVITANNLCTPNASACYFNGTIYLVGGTTQYGASRTPVCLKDDTTTWYQTSPIKNSRTNPLIFTTEKYMFVTGGNSLPNKHFIEYTDGVKNLQSARNYQGSTIYIYPVDWTTAELPADLISTDVHFFPFNSQLCCLHNFNGIIMKFTYNGNWKGQEFPKQFPTELKMNSIIHFPTQKSPFVLISTVGNNVEIPIYALELASLKWSTLPEPKGMCEIRECGNLLKTTCYLSYQT